MDKIADFLARGVENIIANSEALEKLLRSGKTLNVYNGIDPTASHIHIGNAFQLRKLQTLVDLGHNVTFLVGSFTALIGDNSDKETERPILTQEQIEANFADYKNQAEKILDFSKVKIVYNGDWLKNLTFKDIIELCRHFSVGDFVSRELIKKRMAVGERVRLDELLYPVMQGYDCYHLDADLQIGGTDQTFNMQAGRSLQKDLRDKETFVVSTTFLEGTDGRKMSKSWGNAIWLDDPANEMFGKIMSVRDDLILRYFELATNLSLEQLPEVKKRLQSGENPMVLKKELALRIVSELHSEEDAKAAGEHWQKTYSDKQFPTSEAIISPMSSGATIMETLVNSAGLTASEVRDYTVAGAIELNGEKVTDRKAPVKSGDEIKVGKKKFIKKT
jgi:tyrosyl-tRNA synthetase